jgi:hypothetical protein
LRIKFIKQNVTIETASPKDAVDCGVELTIGPTG